MQSAVETLSPTRVRLTVEVPFGELKPELDKAYRTIGAQIKVQGFRPGKVPPRILDQRVGRSVVLEEAVQEALPRLYTEAVTESGVLPVGRPSVDVTKLDDGVELAFTAEVDVRPEFELPAYDSLSVTVPAIAVSDEEIAGDIDELRDSFSTLTPVERPAADGDYLTLDLAATVDGKEVPGGTASDLSYRIGKGDLLEGIDEALIGASAGDARTFQTTLIAGEFAGQVSDVAVTVRTVNVRVLPELDDAFAPSVGFTTVQELQDDVRSRFERVRQLEQGIEARDRVLDALLGAVDMPLPESVVQAEIDWRRESMTSQLQQAGQTLNQYLESQGKGGEEFEEELRETAAHAVKAQFVLDAVADAEQVGVTEAELSDQIVRRAQQARVSPEEYAQTLVQSGGLQGLVAEVRRGKALATVMSGATIQDSSGAPVDLEALREDVKGDDTEHDEAGRPFHTHPDGSVHYLDED